MKFSKIWLFFAVILINCQFTYSQRGKNGNNTVSTANTVLNTYTAVTANITAGATSITVANNGLSGGAFSGSLAQGDLIMIIQMQGATMDINTDPTLSWGGNYTVPNEFMSNGMIWHTLADKWGAVTNYNNCGKFEQAEVQSVTGSTTITLQCPVLNNYTISGVVQVIRVPRFQDLTVNTGASIVPTAWAGQTGGVVAIEVNGNLVINGTGKISATGLGFRGGAADNTGGATSGVSTGYAAYGTGVGDTYLASNLGVNGARKGEGIGGSAGGVYTTLVSDYGRSAPANGGGGAGYQNAGGGGGSNIGTGTYTGKGVPNTAYNAIWNLELAGFGGSSSSGGGRGGYTLSNANADETTIGPNHTAWGTGYRKVEGGLGGHPLTYDNTRLFMGGGGGAGDQDNGQGGPGGKGGGIVFLTVYGAISGTGSIEANGADGSKSNPTNAAPSFGQKKGTDGAGGAGGGGSIYIKNSSGIPASIALNAKGGRGGDNAITLGTGVTTVTEANGPGGGGAGGAIAFTSGSPTQSVVGGASGAVLVSGSSTGSPISAFPPNGATDGAVGMSNLATTIYDLIPINDTICEGETATLSVTVTGTLPAGGVVYWYTQQFGGTSIASGTTFTTPPLSVTTTYYAGVCPGTFRVPVKAVVNPKPVISGTPVITNAGCVTLGSITGLTVSGGTAPYTYSWNGATTATIDLTNAAANTYNLLVTDSKGCTDTDGPHVINTVGGPTINSTAVVVTNNGCNGVLGSITGITATGTGLTYSWSNGGGTALNTSSLTAGNYTLTVTDNTGCTATAGPFTVGTTTGPVIDASAMTTQNVTCGATNGAITGITAIGTALTYSWNGGLANTLDLTNQPAGSYTLTVTDGNGCTAMSGPYAINSNGTLVIDAMNAIVADEHCSQADGSVSGIQVTGATGTVTYSWTNTTQTTLDLTGLSAGTFVLTATDGAGCTAVSSSFTVNNLAGPSVSTASVVVNNENCSQLNGAISGLATSGTGLIYSWSNGGGTNLNPTALAAGVYTLTVTDGFGCSVTAGPYTVGNNAPPTIDVTAMAIQQATCGGTNGAITGITVTGTGLTYNWNNGLSTSLNLTSQGAGTYTLVVTDGNGCTATSGPHTITSAGGFSLDVSNAVVVDDHCSQNMGSITGVIVNGGAPTISYSWSNTTQTTLDLTGLSAGNYVLTATDGNGCVAVSTSLIVNNIGGPVINENAVVITTESCAGGDGQINGITASGSSTLSYSWSNGGIAPDVSALGAGTYTLTVSDLFGCTAVSNPQIVAGAIPLGFDASAVVITPTDCDQNSGAVSGLVVTGGVNPVYHWSNGAPTLNVIGLGQGSYTLSITDQQGCDTTFAVTITMSTPPVIDVSAVMVTDVHCNQNDGGVTGISVSGGTPDYEYKWNGDPVLNTLDLSNQPPGLYSLLVTDNAGCTDTRQILIGNMPGPVIDLSNMVVTPVGCSEPGRISGVTIGGFGPYTYEWSNGSTALNLDNVMAGDYSLTVTDIFGCSATSAPVNLVDLVHPQADFYWAPQNPVFGDDVKFMNNSDNAVTYLWDFGDGTGSGDTEPTHIYMNEDSSSYNITLVATSIDGCVDSITYTIVMETPVIVYVPNSFTPNERDNINKTFKPVVTSGVSLDTYSMYIFNRWGEIIFESHDSDQGWDGTYKGILQQDGTYTWRIDFKLEQTDERRLLHGSVNLLK